MSEQTPETQEKRSIIPDWHELIEFLHAKDAPVAPKVLFVIALVYLLWPLDLIPDIVPILGWLDDLGVSIIALSYLGYTMDRYFGKLSSEAPKKSVKKPISRKQKAINRQKTE